MVLVEDAETGKRLYDIIKSLTNWESKIISDHIELQMIGYIEGKGNSIQMFFANVDFTFEDNWQRCSTLDKLQEFVSFTHAMQKRGYLLDADLFDNETCQNISDFLSFFRPGGEEEEASNGCIISYIHYCLSGGNSLEDTYAPIVKENRISSMSDFPYHMPMITMCYYYYLNGMIPKDINVKYVLKEEKIKHRYGTSRFESEFMILGNPDLSSQLPITEVTEIYTVYNACIKIYKEEISEDFKRFLETENSCRPLLNENNISEEHSVKGIVDFSGKLIGYQYVSDISYDKQFISIFEKEFNSQGEILNFLHSMQEFLQKNNNMSCFHFDKGGNKFNLETDIVYYKDGQDFNYEYEFKILSLENLYYLIKEDSEKLKEQITTTFFKLLHNCLQKKYGILYNRKQILEKREVRYLNPIVADEFSKFVLGREIDLGKAADAFYQFMFTKMAYAEEDFMCDKDFQYNSSTPISFLFEYEAESKYGIKLKNEKNIVLPDDRKVVLFSNKIGIKDLRKKLEERNEEIDNYVGHINTEYVKLISVSEIICSSKLNKAGEYDVIGYITEPLHGIPLTYQLLSEFNNKEILQVAGKLISNVISHFNYYYIDWADGQFLIDIDKNNGEFTFYIDILDPNFRISYTRINSAANEMVEYFFRILVKDYGYNPNAFVGIPLSADKYHLQYDLMASACDMDAYCDVHKIYYNSNNKMCPACLETQYTVSKDFENEFKKVFEDSYAIHYSNSKYGLKIYKREAVDLKYLERNVTAWIKLGKNEKEFITSLRDCSERQKDISIQDGFIPYKKALNEEHQFIGYLYLVSDFTDTNCINLNDTERMLNRPRIMSLIRLMKQVRKYLLSGYSFYDNPFGDVFLCKDLKKQVQIVNIDFLSLEKMESSLGKNTDWLYKYVCSTMEADKDIDLDTSKLSKNIEKMISTLEEFTQDLTVQCPIHRIFYRSKEVFCPRCVTYSQKKNFKIEQIDPSEIETWNYDNRGGESTIYLRKDGTIAKVFNDKIQYSLKMKVLATIFSKKKILEEINQEKQKFKLVIPKKLLVNKQNYHIIGYIMSEKIEGKPITILRDKEQLSNLNFSRKDVFEILITVGEGIQALHDKANIYIGDLNGRNILVDKEKNVYFLDFDGMGMDDIKPPFTTEGYIDPVSQKANQVTPKDDWYSFAIQAFYYLTFTHPFNGIYKEGKKSLEIPDRMERRLSLLGNHGILPPSIAEPWDWMNKELINAFLNTFEGDRRVSIVPELKKQYQEKYGGTKYLTTVSEIRINAKFMAKRKYPFDESKYSIIRMLTPNIAICSRQEDEYSVILSRYGNEYNVHFLDCLEILDILDLGTHVIAIYHDKIIGFDLMLDKEVFFESFNYKSDKFVVNHDTLYLSKSTREGDVIFQIKFDEGSDGKRDKIKFLPEEKTVAFLVEMNSKFMLIKRNSKGTDSIYCNHEKLCDITSDFKDSKYHILYDKTTRLWLVINQKGSIITVDSSNGHYKESNIPVKIDDIDVKNVAFDKGILYIPSQGSLYIVQVKKEMKAKQLECDTLITPNSRLYNFNSNGFSVITDYILYDIYKG